MGRWTLVMLVVGVCLQKPLEVCAQQPGKDFRIGLLFPGAESIPERVLLEVENLRVGLRDLGWVEGKNLTIETCLAGANPQRQRELAAELKALPVALIIAPGTITIRAARDGAPACPS